MSNFFLFFILALCSCVPALIVRKIFSQRIQQMELDLRQIYAAVSQMAEMQAQSHRKFSTSQEDLEERIMELSIPVRNPKLPLERRYQVMTLAKRGIAPEEIARRLKAPVGETELILNLGKYAGMERKHTDRHDAQVKQYA